MEDNIVSLVEEIPALQLFYDTTITPSRWNVTDNLLISASGWEVITPAASGPTDRRLWAFQTSIDVSGWGNQGLTFYPLQAGVQEGYMFTYLNDSCLQVIDVVSDCPLDLGNFAFNNLVNFPYKTVPGLYQRVNLTSTVDQSFQPLEFDNVLYGQSRVMGYNSNFPTEGGIPLVSPININDFGSMTPTASDKLYITRILVCNNSARTGGFMNCPPTRFVIKGQLMRESDLSYVYRLKNSFKTTQTDVQVGPDV